MSDDRLEKLNAVRDGIGELFGVKPPPLPGSQDYTVFDERLTAIEEKLASLETRTLTKQDLPEMSVDGKPINPMYCALRTPHNALMQQFGTGFKTNSKERDVWYRTDLSLPFQYNGTYWKSMMATQERFFSDVSTNGGFSAANGFPLAVIDANNEEFRQCFLVPDDFVAITEMMVLCYSTNNKVGCNIDIWVNYGTVGELTTAHSGSDTATTYDFTQNLLTEIDISALATSLAAGDYVGVQFRMKELFDDIHVIGIRFKYR